jgi:CheY-like chemotaxis protein
MSWKILVVDDEPVNLEIIAEYLDDPSYTLTSAEDGQVAWDYLQTGAAVDLVLLDRMMPRMNGMEVLKRLKSEERFRDIPVIMQTAASSPAQVREGIAAGAYYYLTKPYEPDTLLGIVRAALAEIDDRRQSARAAASSDFSLPVGSVVQFNFRTLQEAHDLAGRLAALCPDPAPVAMGLTELLVNAIEHGNLEISYADKKRLRQEDGWEDEVERRLASADFAARQARVQIDHRADRIVFTVEDQGPGFDWRRYLDFDPERAFDPNGRGIAMARQVGFGSLEYQGRGNIVVATVPRVSGGAA